MFLRNGIRVADKYFDAWKQAAHSTYDGGMRYLLMNHANKLPPLSKTSDPFGVLKKMAPNDILRLSHCPPLLLETNDGNLFGSFSGSVYDPYLTSVFCSDEFGEKTTLILDQTPPNNVHSCVALVQLDTCFD
eukprot:14942605-Ditylum_brightwellii.AAC.1